MAISGIDSGAAEHERYLNSIRERDEAHNREVSTLQDRQKRAINRLDETQSKNLSEVEKRSNSRLEKQAEEQQRIVEKLGDRFEKQRKLDRREYYDRFGRASEGFTKDIQSAKSGGQEQLKGLIESHEQEKQHLAQANDETIHNMRRQGEQERDRLEGDSKNHTDQQTEKFQKDLTDLNKENRHKLDDQIRMNFEEMRKQRSSSDERLQNDHNQNSIAQQNTSNAFRLREKQLMDEKTFQAQQLDEKGISSLEQNRARLGENLDRVIKDNHFYNAKKDMNFSSTLSQQNHENQSKLQDQRLAYERMLLGERGQSHAREDKEQMSNELLRRQMAYENYLAHEGIKNKYEDAIKNINESHSSSLQEQNLKNQTQYDETKRSYQKRLAALDNQRTVEVQDKGFDAIEKAREEQMHHLRQREQMASDFRISQSAQESSLKRQKGETDEYYQKRIQETNQNKAETIAQNNAEAQFKLSKQKNFYENINRGLENEKKTEVASKEQSQRSQLERVSQTYRENLIDADKIQKSQLTDLKRSFSEAMDRQHNEDEAKLKDMSQEYEFRIRSMASDYENRISDMTQGHDREVNQMKRENERQRYEMAAKSKAELENLMESHKKEMASQDSQFKEKFRLTKMNNEQELSRVKRSNELLTKKS